MFMNPGVELVFSAEPRHRLLTFSPHPLRNKTQHRNKTRRRTEVIHRLYPIINIQAVVCTNTPSNHGGSPGRRIIFKLGSMVPAMPPPSCHSLPLLPGRQGTGTGGSPHLTGLRGPTGKRGAAPTCRASLPKAKAQPRSHRSLSGDGFSSGFAPVLPWLPPHLAPPRHPLPHAGLGRG